MRKFLALVLAMATFAVASCEKENKETPYNPDGSPITQVQALEIVKEDVDMYDVVYVSKSVMKKGTKFKPSLSLEERTVPCDSWVVMINTDPLSNGGPVWLYIYVALYSGNSDMDSWECGLPIDFEFDCIKYDVSKCLDNRTPFSDVFDNSPDTRSQAMVSNNWAVIISGGANPDSNYERYWNDCSAIYKCLRQVHGYRKDRIFVLMSDGTSSGMDRRMNNGTYMSSPQDLDGDGVGDINYSATKSNISTVFNKLKNNVSQDEQVLVFVTDHGGRENGESTICLWNNTEISATDFAKEVAKINSSSRKHVVLGQCYSGGFIGPLSSRCYNIAISAASEADQLSAAMEGAMYDEFLYHWISAAAGTSPDGAPIYADQNGYDGVSVEEVFKYAAERDAKAEHPQYFSTPEPMGEKYGLSGMEMGYPVFTGPSHLSSNPINGTFTLSNLPETYTVNWVSNSKISFTPLSQTSATARSVSQVAMDGDWARMEITTPFKTYRFKCWTYLWRPGISFTTDLISGTLEQGCFSLPYHADGVTGYQWWIDIPGYYDIPQSNAYFIDVPYAGDAPESYHVSVDFTNPLGEQTTIVRYYE